jgi:predicted nucleic acid-binding protein
VTVFLDTVGLIALWDEIDQWHPAARAAFDRLMRERSNVVTTTYVMLECGNTAARRPFRDAVVEMREQLSVNSGLIAPTQQDALHAWSAYARGEGSRAGIVDQVSFVVMRRLGIQQAFTNDEHFRAAGFETLF